MADALVQAADPWPVRRALRGTLRLRRDQAPATRALAGKKPDPPGSPAVSAQRLSGRSTRRIARATGLPVIRAWSHGGYSHDFVTAGHLHGWYDLKTGEWGIHSSGRQLHYNTCPGGSGAAGPDAIFPDGVPPLTPAETRAALQARADTPV